MLDAATEYMEDKSDQEQQSRPNLWYLFSGVLFATISRRNKTMMALNLTEHLFCKLCVSYFFFFFFCFPLFNNKVWIFRAIHAPPSLWALSFTYEKQVQNITYQVVWHQREILDSRQVQDDHKAVLCTWFGKLQSSELWCILEQIVLCSFRCRTVQSFTSILAVKYKFFVY